MKYFILFGPPGAGKGTQAAPLVKSFGLKHISTGELLRAEIAAGTERGLQAAALIDKGNLVPDSMVEEMLCAKFDEAAGCTGFLLDGFPRTESQAADLDRMLGERGESVTAVLSLTVSDETIHSRLARRAVLEGRADDANDEIISNRIKTYHEKTEPLIKYYKAAGKYHEILSEGAVEEVSGRVFKVVEKYFGK